MATRSDMGITLVVRGIGMCISAGVMSFFMWKMFEYLDPRYESKKAAKKKVDEIRKILHLNPKIELNMHELRLATQIVMPDEGANIDEIGGCSELLKQLEDNVLMPLRLRKSQISFPSAFYSPPKGILLHGPPGCGKTLIARAISKEANAIFINFDISVLSDMWYGETSKFTKALFTLSEKIQPCIIFIDEIDSILRSRTRLDHEATAVMKTQFMAHWDGFAQSDSAVVIIGATNRPEDVDDAILRRLPFRIHVPRPDAIAREEILRVLLRNEKIVADFDYCEVANKTESMSGSELKECVRFACLNKYHDAVQAAINSPEQLQKHIDEVQITTVDVVNAAENFKKNTRDLKALDLLVDSLNLD